MNKPLLVLIGAGCLVSCNKDGNKPDNSWTWFGTDNPAVYNYVLINASQVINKADSGELHVGVSAAFIDSNNHQVTVVGALSVNNQEIHPGVDYTYRYDYLAGTPKAPPLFGTNVEVAISGIEPDDSISKTVYLPKQLMQLISAYPDTIHRSRGIQLTWSPDEENTWGNVLIQLFYFSDLSRKADSTLPDKIETVSITAPDNGQYFLTPGELAAFPVKSVMGITIARGSQNQAILPLSHKRIFYFSSASVSTLPLPVTE
ncbi:MAG TPA: hypothetical protein VHC50_09585 [Puia sp.]|jgi:hypothetical protein|nr:hypothetical protein [Puia sp.]